VSHKPKERSVAVLVIGALVAVTTLSLGTLGVHNHRMQKAQAEANLATELELTTNQLALGLALPLWNFDRPQVVRLLDGVMENRDIEAIVVRQVDASAPGGVTRIGRARDASWRAVPSSTDLAPSELPSAQRTIASEGQHLGSLKVVATTRFMQERLKESLLTLALEIGVVDLVLIVALWLVLQRTVLGPLAALEKFARDVSNGEDAAAARPRRSFRGELESLRVSVERTFALLGSRYAELVASEAERKRADSQREDLEQQVRQAQKLEAMGTLAGGIAHDFNNILAAIMSYAEMLLLDLPQGSPLRKDAAGIQASVSRATSLVKQILAFSRKTPHEMRTIELTHVVREALDMLRATLPTTTALHVQIKGKAPVVADPTEMHQVVVNLGTNAWKALNDGRGTLIVTLETVTLDAEASTKLHGVTPGRYVRLSVTDDGVGMAPDLLERIFDPFFTTRPEGEGTGLGLAVVHGIVSRSKGVITVTSEVGKGSTFSVHLPLVEGDAMEQTVAEDEPLSGTERLLYVDDEPDLTETMERKLSRLGYRVSTLNSSPAAFNALREAPQSFDLVITDLTMPVLRGDQLARLVRGIRADLPIVICTGSQEDLKGEWVEKLGHATLVHKPVSLPDLTRVIRRLVDEPGAS
jgi:signal transduction histidine kinase/CheY-like chemotaxis protein